MYVTFERTPDELYNSVGQRHDYGIDVYTNQIDLMAETGHEEEPGVDYNMSTRFIRNMTTLMANGNSSIIIHLKSVGGSFRECIAIYNMIKYCPNKTIIINHTQAESSSGIILQAADIRIMMPDTYFMYHAGNESYSGTPRQIKTQCDFFESDMNWMMKVYADSVKKFSKSHKKKTIKQIEKLLQDTMLEKEDVYLTDHETVEWGFADGIFGQKGVNWKSIYSI